MGWLSRQSWEWRVSSINFYWEGFIKSVTMFMEDSEGNGLCIILLLTYFFK